MFSFSGKGNTWCPGCLTIFYIGLVLFGGALFFVLLYLWVFILLNVVCVDEKIVKNAFSSINLLNIISEKISYLPFTCFPCREG